MVPKQHNCATSEMVSTSLHNIFGGYEYAGAAHPICSLGQHLAPSPYPCLNRNETMADHLRPTCDSPALPPPSTDQSPEISRTVQAHPTVRSAALERASIQFETLAIVDRARLIQDRIGFLSWYIRQIRNRIASSSQAWDTAAFYFWYETLTSCLGGTLLDRVSLRGTIRAIETDEEAELRDAGATNGHRPEWETWAQAIRVETEILLDNMSRFDIAIARASQHCDEQEFHTVHEAIKDRMKDNHFAILGADPSLAYHEVGIRSATVERFLHQMRTVAKSRMIRLAPNHDFGTLTETLWDEIENVQHSAYHHMLKQAGEASGIVLVEMRHRPLVEDPSMIYV